jgi:hypothetical protein
MLDTGCQEIEHLAVGWVKSLKKLTSTDEANVQPLIDPGKKT